MKSILQTNRLQLREITSSEQDTDFVYRALSDPDVYRYYGIRLLSREEAAEQMEWYRNLRKTNSGIWWMILTEQNQVPVGACGLNDMNLNKGVAEIGCWLLPEHQGKGLMSEALYAVLEYAGSKPELKSLKANIETENAASIRLFRRLGFSKDPASEKSEEKYGKTIRAADYIYTF